MKIVLLTHERELIRPTNTGQWVTQSMGELAEVITWQRKLPNEALLKLIATQRVGFVFPDAVDSDAIAVSEVDSTPLSTNAVTVSSEKNGSVRMSSDKEMTPLIDFDALVIIDATWQEARKIYNRSPYIKQLEKVSLAPKAESLYQLRRNQVEGGLCTAECAIEILNSIGETEQAKSIMSLLMLQLNRQEK
ncbi:tRNA-uridine aminocarboxypropyltransferase [Shewanella donghaensis]|uniref:tRNA-uridine aminocarboxypropyltransferase n=1 Tax=Shewanella donghaensis TaxID=238836 RepID=UPI001182F2C4|nr:tRNA-uridine aminocarboxypropyltransferase [Shewanella donghaensis]